MTYAMKIQEERDEARAESQMEGKVEAIKSLMETTGWAIPFWFHFGSISPNTAQHFLTPFGKQMSRNPDFSVPCGMYGDKEERPELP